MSLLLVSPYVFKANRMVALRRVGALSCKNLFIIIIFSISKKNVINKITICSFIGCKPRTDRILVWVSKICMTFKITSLFVSSKLTWHWGNKNLIKFAECLFSHSDTFSSFKCYHLKIGYNTSYCREVLKLSSESSKSKTKLLMCSNNSVLERNDINSVAPFLFNINWILYVENYLARKFRYKRLQLLYPIQQNNFRIVLGNLIFISFCMLIFCSYPLSWWCCSWILNGNSILNKVKSWVCLGRGEEFNFKVCQICMHIKGFFFFLLLVSFTCTHLKFGLPVMPRYDLAFFLGPQNSGWIALWARIPRHNEVS